MTNFRFNILFLMIAAAIAALYAYGKKGQEQAHLFFGVAENEETEINFDKDLTVRQIFVEVGQSVKKGEPLLLVERADLALKKENLTLDAQKTGLEENLKKADLKAKIVELEAEKADKNVEFEAKIKTLTAQDDYRKWLSEGLKTIENPKTEGLETTPTAARIAALQSERTSALAVYDTRIRQYEALIQSIEKPFNLERTKIRSEQAALSKETERLNILAPSDGIVGNVRCRVGENKSAFDVLISFYEKSPNLVVGYVQESLLVHVKKGDSLLVQSHTQPEKKYSGQITGLGYRVVEIPERLRRFPEIKTYGREVLVRIPSDNLFLQNEKVRLVISE